MKLHVQATNGTRPSCGAKPGVVSACTPEVFEKLPRAERCGTCHRHSSNHAYPVGTPRRAK